MELANYVIGKLLELTPSALAICLTVVIVAGIRYLMNRRHAYTADGKFRLNILIMLISLVGLVVVILVLPVSESTIGQLLSLLGLLLSAAIALSATTFVGNIMAGLMLRGIRNFRPGDFIRVGDHFGRVSDRGLFHVEIQTEERDLTTLPNLYLVTNPVKVVRSSGTLLTAEVSLGYDIHWKNIERALLAAADEAGLEEPFVHIMELGDFSVKYRVAGLLTDVKGIISARSKLRESVLDSLHRAGIEIVSPTFMNQRALSEHRRFIPDPPRGIISQPEIEDAPEKLLFDKADRAESIEKLKFRKESLQKELEELKAGFHDDADESAKENLKLEVENIKIRIERLSEYIAQREKGKD